MILVLGIIGSIVMAVLNATDATNTGWWALTPFVVGLILQIIIWANAGGDAAGGCLGGLGDIADIFD